MVAKQTMILEEPHEECNITLDRGAITLIDIPTTDELIEMQNMWNLKVKVSKL